MSQFATIYSVPKDFLTGLNREHSPSEFENKILTRAKEIAEFDYDGYVFLMAAEYLSEVCNIPILDSSYNWIAIKLAEVSGSYFFLDYDLCKSMNERLQSLSVTSVQLNEFYETFNEVGSQEYGKAMLAGINLFRHLTTLVDKNKLLLIAIQ